jgi:hypothetical protein
MPKEFLADVDLKGTVLLNGAAGTSGYVLTSQGSGQKPIWAAAAGAVSIATSAADVLSANSGEITADDAGSDKLVFWDDSASKLTYLATGAGLSITGTTVSTDAKTKAATNIFLWSNFR